MVDMIMCVNLQHMVQSSQRRDGLKSEGFPQSDTYDEGCINSKLSAGMVPDNLLPCKWMSFKNCKLPNLVSFPMNLL